MHALKLYCILGTTASGKSEVAVKLATFLGEKTVVLGCDASQVYQGLIIGAGTVEGVQIADDFQGSVCEYKGVKHYGITMVPLGEKYSIAKYVEYCRGLFAYFAKDGVENVVLVGGTAFYAEAIIRGFVWNGGVVGESFDGLADWQLRGRYYDEVVKTGRILNNSDVLNRRRLLSYLSPSHKRIEDRALPYVCAFIGKIIPPQNELNKRIEIRLLDRWKDGKMWSEFLTLYSSFPQVATLGLEYRAQEVFLLGWVDEKTMLELLGLRIRQYAKRQKTYLQRLQGDQFTSAEELLQHCIKHIGGQIGNQ